jgi:glycosyltransferase involved in cell wall biosynthesis
MNSTELTVVMPVYNEEPNIGSVITQWLETLGREHVVAQLIAVNDGSTDGTWNKLAELQLRFPRELVLINKTNSGHGQSCRAGYEAALARQTQWILQIDSDGQCDPVFFPIFWAARHQADCIFGIRTRREDGYSRKVVSMICRILMATVTGRDLKDVNVPYRLIKRTALETALRAVPKNFDLQNVALTLALKRNRAWHWTYVPIRFRARQGGTNSINLRKIAKMGFRMLCQIREIGSPRLGPEKKSGLSGGDPVSSHRLEHGSTPRGNRGCPVANSSRPTVIGA